MAGSTPVFGFPYPEPSDLVANYPALGQQLAEDVEDEIIASGGLSLVTATSFTTQSSVSINNCFSATYANYRIIGQTVGSLSDPLSAAIRFRLRASGSDNSTSNYYEHLIYSTNSGGPTRVYSPVETRGTAGWSATVRGAFALDITGPNIAQPTIFLNLATGWGSPNNIAGSTYGNQVQSNAFDGITFFPDSGTITGNIRVYGYKNS